MTKTPVGVPFTIALQIPTYWTPEQALAVFELVTDLRDAIWQCYGLQLIEQYRDQFQPADIDPADKAPDDPPF